MLVECVRCIAACPDLAYGSLKNWWEEENLKSYAGPPRVGFDADKYFWRVALPSRLLPRIFMVAWVAIIRHRLTSCTTHS